MTIAFIQQVESGSSPISVTNVAAGSLLVASAIYEGNSAWSGAPSISDDKGNSWIFAGYTYNSNTAPGSYQISIWQYYCLSAASGTTSVTMSLPGSANVKRYHIAEFSHDASLDIVDCADQSFGNSTSPTSGAATGSGGVGVGIVKDWSSGSPQSAWQIGGVTPDSTTTEAGDATFSYKVSALTNPAMTATLSSAGEWAALLGLFAESTGPTPPTFTGPDIQNQEDPEDSPIAPLGVSGSFDDGGGVYSPGYVGTSLPVGLSIDALTGVITGTPTEPLAGVGYTVTLVTDQGQIASNPFNWTITDATSPSLSAPQITGVTDTTLTPQVVTNDIDNGQIWCLTTAGATNPDATAIKATGALLTAPIPFPTVFPEVTGLTADTLYQCSFYQEDQVGNPSNIQRATATTQSAGPTVTVYTVAADKPAGADSILDGSGCGIGNDVEVPDQTDQGNAITWYEPFDGTFLINNATGQKTFTARSRVNSGSAWTPAATFTVN